ncbi:MAG TPA: hypothetical protein VKA49_18720 [Flavitalea sp.]|nr:hypothetical protein [Flavitalea sp.]
MVAGEISYDMFLNKFRQMGGTVEAVIDGHRTELPSVQCRLTPTGVSEVLFTHDQELGGESGQVYIVAQFPASEEYAVEIREMGKKVSDALLKKESLEGLPLILFQLKKMNSGSITLLRLICEREELHIHS